MSFRNNNIIVLLGAGASVDAGIPASVRMVQDLEHLLIDDLEWKPYKELYDFVKSSIRHGDGINGIFDKNVNYNIERLVSVLAELEQNRKHPLYPFINGWKFDLMDLGGTNLKFVSELKNKIIKRLKESWILVENYENANYYQGFEKFQREYQYPLRVFTLNYDLCLEKACANSEIERGFNGRTLDVQRFEGDEDRLINIFLYKIHGSIDWKKDIYGSLTFSDEPGSIPANQLEIIFGTNQKLRSVDPYLFLIHDFRKYCLKTKIILVIGYSFGDTHINEIIAQALNENSDRRVVVVTPVFPPITDEQILQEIVAKLSCVNSQIFLINEKAKPFMESCFSVEYLSKFLFPEDIDF